MVHNLTNGSTGANTNGQCAYAMSMIQASDALGFVSTGANNYHTTAVGTLRDMGGNSSSLLTDVDGESRPYGSAFDSPPTSTIPDHFAGSVFTILRHDARRASSRRARSVSGRMLGG